MHWPIFARQRKSKSCIFHIFFVRLCRIFATKLVLNMVTTISTKSLNRFLIRHLVKISGFTFVNFYGQLDNDYLTVWKQEYGRVMLITHKVIFKCL